MQTPPVTPDLPHIMLAALAIFLRQAWPLLTLFVLVGLARFAWQIRGILRLKHAGMNEIDGMDGITFEKRLQSLFTASGYRVELTPPRGDFGGDLILSKDGVKTVVQAKRYSRAVGVKAVQEAVAARGFYGCASAMVVTNRTFTPQAERLASANQVVLWGRQRLTQALLDVQTPSHAAHGVRPQAAPPAFPPANLAPPIQPASAAKGAAVASDTRCAMCGKSISEKVRQFCAAHPGRFAGQTYCYEHQRGR